METESLSNEIQRINDQMNKSSCDYQTSDKNKVNSREKEDASKR